MALVVYGLLEIFRANYLGYGNVKLLGAVIANGVYGSSLIPNPNGVVDFLRETMATWKSPLYHIDIIYPTTCHLWFLPSFFTGKMIFSFVMKKIKKLDFSYFLIIIGLVAMASLESILSEYGQFPYGIGRGFLFAGFMMFGYFLKKLALFEKNNMRIIVSSSLIGFSFFLVARLLGNGSIAWILSYYGSHGVFGAFIEFIGGAGASIGILYIFLFMEKTFSKTPKFILSKIGRNTMPIYLWHMIFLTAIDVLFGIIFNKTFSPDEYFVNLFTNEMVLYNIAKGIIAIILCMISIEIFEKIKCVQNK